MPADELVLCSARADLPTAWLPFAGAVPLAWPHLLDGLRATTPHWLPRSQAEQDPVFKQWIPYVLLQDDRGALAAYPRRGAEHRLHGRLSLGLGGHVNPVDAGVAGTADTVWPAALEQGLRRELREEFPAACAGTTTFLGLVNEDTGPVGRVHLGAVFLHRIAAAPPAPPGELAGLVWVPRRELASPPWPLVHFETWSQLALELLDRPPPSP